jgi:hypothetical protein
MTFIHIDTEDHFTELEFCISGTAKVEIEAARFNDRDIGGTDGIETSAEIIHVKIGALEISRSQLVEAFSRGMVEDFEERIAYEYRQGLAA